MADSFNDLKGITSPWVRQVQIDCLRNIDPINVALAFQEMFWHCSQMSKESPNLDTVKERRSAIKTELAELNGRVSALNAEDQELAVAERVLMRLSGTQPQPFHDEALGDWLLPWGWKTPDNPPPLNGTVEELIVWLLSGSVSPWATAGQIQAAFANIINRPVPHTTISPTLTNMKNKGIIVRDGLKVALATRVPKNNEAAQDQSVRRL